jgi:transcriptional regulator with XRE-family HTH domain
MPNDSSAASSAGNPPVDPDMELVYRIVSILHQARLERKMTLRVLGEKSQLNFSHLGRAERRATQPSLMILLKWCRALDLKFERVLKQALKETNG